MAEQAKVPMALHAHLLTPEEISSDTHHVDVVQISTGPLEKMQVLKLNIFFTDT